MLKDKLLKKKTKVCVYVKFSANLISTVDG